MDKNNYYLGMYEKAMPADLSWREKLNKCKEFGFDWVEISIDESDEKLSRLDWSAEERNYLINLIKETGVPINTMCLSGHRKYPMGSNDQKIELKAMEIMEKAIQLAHDLGIRVIQLAGYDVYYEPSTTETRNRFLKNLHTAVEMASKQGVVLGFETMDTEFMNTVGKAMRYVNTINSPFLQIYPDIGNLQNAGYIYNTSVLDDIKSGKGHIIAAHLKETIPGHDRGIPFGAGHTDYENDINALKELGVRMFNGEFWCSGNTWEEDAKFACQFLRGKLNAVFN